MDYRRYNGAALLGLRGLVFKSHGSADEMAFEQALNRAYDAARNNLLDRVRPAHCAVQPFAGGRMAKTEATWRQRHFMRRYSRITGTGSYLPPRR
jgi:glycerol-3-phosphate acyltransferase PlsX